jgi:2-hydroxy-6-oxonona-2,4-dienedioate hydrolase
VIPLASRWTELDGLRLHARVAERPGAEAIVLVHGIAVSSRYMIPVARELAGFASLYAVDLPGFGRSTKPRRSLGVAELARSLAAWMDAAAITRPTLLANSFGCQVVTSLAAREPARADRLVLVGPTTDGSARSEPRQIARWIASALYERPSLPFVLARDALDAGPRRIWETFEASLTDRVEERLPLVRAPTLVVRGERDPIVPQRWAEEVTARLPDARLVVVPRGGHALNYSRPRDLARLVRAFLAGEA